MFSHKVMFYQTRMSSLQQRALLRALRYDGIDPDRRYPPEVCMVIWLMQALGRTRLIDSDRQQYLLAEMADSLQGAFEGIREGDPVPNYQIVFAEGRYATWTGKTGFIDFVTGENVESTPRPIMDSFGINLTEMYQRSFERCTRLQTMLEQEDRDASNADQPEEPAAGSVDPQG